MSVCQAIGCYNTKGKDPVRFHQFPDPNHHKEQAAVWLHNIGAGYTLQTFTFGSSKFLCSDHFHPDCYEKDSKNKLLGYVPRRAHLKLGALPTIFKNKVFEIININGEKINLPMNIEKIKVSSLASKQTSKKKKKSEDKKKMKQSTLSFVQKDKNILPTFVKVNNKTDNIDTDKTDTQDLTKINKDVPVKAIVIGSPKNRSQDISNGVSSSKNGLVVTNKFSKTAKTISNGSIRKTENYKIINIPPIKKLNRNVVKVDSDSDDENDEVPLAVLKKRLVPLKNKNNVVPLRPTGTLSASANSPVKSLSASPIRLTSANIQKLLPNLKPIKTHNLQLAGTPRNQAIIGRVALSGNHHIQPKIGSLPQSGLVPSKPFITGSLTNPINLAARIGSLPAQRPMKPIVIMPTNKINITPPKNIVIAIDMDPQQWKKLPAAEQRRIIEEKKQQAHQKYIAVALKNAQQNAAAQTTLCTFTPRNFLSPLKPPKMPSSINNTIMNAVGSLQKIISSPPSTVNKPILPNNNNNQQFHRANFTDLISEKRYELDLTGLKPLPRPKRIRLPSELKGKHFGDVAMIIEFVNTFKNFLMIEEDVTFTSRKLIYGLTCQKETETVSKILLYFLKTLLGNENFKIKGLKMELADLPLTEYTVSYLVEQFLKSHQEKRKKLKRAEEIAAAAAKMIEESDTSDGLYDTSVHGYDSDYVNVRSDDDDDDDDDEWVRRKKKTKSKQSTKMKKEGQSQDEKLQSISRFLEKNEFHRMRAENQLEVLTFLLHLINDSDDLLNYHDELLQQKNEALKNLDQYRRLKREEKLAAFAKQNEAKKLTADNNMTIDEFATKIPNAAQLTADIQTVAKQTVLDKKSNDLNKEEKCDLKNENVKQETPANTPNMVKDSDNIKKDEKNTSKNSDGKNESSKDNSNNRTSSKESETNSNNNTNSKESKTNSNNSTNSKESETNSNNSASSKESETNSNNNTSSKESEMKKEDKETGKNDPYAGMTQRQVQVIKLEAKKAEEQKHEEQRLSLEREKVELQALNKKLAETTSLSKKAVRLEPLGFDRFNRSYWLFSQSTPGFYVNSYDEWFVFEDFKSVEELLSALTILGIREDKLKKQIRFYSKNIKDTINQYVEEFSGIDFSTPNTSTANLDVLKNKNFSPSRPNESPKSIDNKGISSPKLNDGSMKTPSAKSIGESSNVSSPRLNNSNINTGADANTESRNPKTPQTKESPTLPVVKSKNETVDDSSDKRNSIDKFDEKSVVDTNSTKSATESAKLAEKEPSTDSLVNEPKGSSLNSSSLTDSPKNDNVNQKPTITSDGTSTEKNNGKKTDDTSIDHLLSSIEALKTDMFESSERIIQGSLGSFVNYDEWSAELTSAESIEDLKEYVLAIQNSIFEKSFLFPFKGFDPVFSTEWCKAVQKAETMSKLHTMYGILENSISWEKSSESLRCKACRRKQGVRNSTPMVICDACQNPYHMNCIRPPLTQAPKSLWRCPKCIPKGSRPSISTCLQVEQGDTQHQSTEETTQSDHEDLCHVCGSDGLMILCDTCPLSFHFECHDPPLRRAPKGSWSCYVCRQGNKKKLLKKKSQKNGKKTGDESDDDDEGSENNSFESDANDFQEERKNGKYQTASSKQENILTQNGRKRKRVNYNEGGGSDNDTDDFKRRPTNKKNNCSNNKRQKQRSSKSRKKQETTSNAQPSSGDGSLKVVLKKIKSSTSSPDKSDNNDETFDNVEEWETKSRSSAASSALSLGNKRPRYAKDGVNGRSKSRNKNNTLSSENSDTEAESRPPGRKVTRIGSNSDTCTQRNNRNSRSSRRECNYELKACRNILVELRNSPDAELFQNPVNRRTLPGYYSIIEHPMDIATIMKKLDSLQYDDVIAFVDDVKLIFSNCERYYKNSNSEFTESAVRLSVQFNKLLQQHLPGMAS